MKYERGSFITVPSREVLRGMPVPAQALYMWLCSYANETGECYPARSTLARDCDCSLPTIDRFTQLLIDRGLLKVEKRVKNGEKMTNLYSVVIVVGGGKGGLQPSQRGLQGVVKEVDIELNPVLTQSTEGGADAPLSYELEEDKKKPPKTTNPKNKAALALVHRCYDLMEKEWGVRPTMVGEDYFRTLEAKKLLKDSDIITMVGDALANGKAKTLREMLTARAVDIYRQENL